MTEALTM